MNIQYTERGVSRIQLIIALVAVLLLGVGLFAMNRMQVASVAKKNVEAALKNGDQIPATVTFDMDEFLISSKDRGIIKCKIQLGLSSGAMLEEMRRKIAIIRDIVARILADQSIDGANKAFRKKELHIKIRDALNSEMSPENGWFKSSLGFISSMMEKLKLPRKVVAVNFHEFMAR